MDRVQKKEDERLLLSFQDFLLLERELAALSIKAYVSDLYSTAYPPAFETASY